MSSMNESDPRSDGARAADTTARIHLIIACLYGAIGLIALLALGADGKWDMLVVMGLLFGAIAGLHAVLAAGARRRSDAAKTGSVIVGALMLLGFPLGTLIGGYLIYNATRNWPPRRDPRAAAVAPAGADMRSL